MFDKTNVVSWWLDGKKYDVDLYDIDGVEWRDAKAVTGQSQAVTCAEAIGGDLVSIAAILWLWRRRDEPGLRHDDVLRAMSYSSMIAPAETEADAAPPA